MNTSVVRDVYRFCSDRKMYKEKAYIGDVESLPNVRTVRQAMSDKNGKAHIEVTEGGALPGEVLGSFW